MEYFTPGVTKVTASAQATGTADGRSLFPALTRQWFTQVAYMGLLITPLLAALNSTQALAPVMVIALLLSAMALAGVGIVLVAQTAAAIARVLVGVKVGVTDPAHRLLPVRLFIWSYEPAYRSLTDRPVVAPSRAPPVSHCHLSRTTEQNADSGTFSTGLADSALPQQWLDPNAVDKT